MPPFVIFSLPRSRSAWLSAFLSRPGALVGHDTGIGCARPEDFADRLRVDLAGTCETGAAFAWRLIRQMLPEARFAVIRRPVGEVIDSLRRQGLYGLDAEMERRDALLDEIAAEPRTLSLRVEQLSDRFFCGGLYEFCMGQWMEAGWHAHMDALNVQVDLPTRLRTLAENAERIAALKAEVERQLAHV